MRSSVRLVPVFSCCPYICSALIRVQLWDFPKLIRIVVSLATDFSNVFDIPSSQVSRPVTNVYHTNGFGQRNGSHTLHEPLSVSIGYDCREQKIKTHKGAYHLWY
jgi:hypothetical protein